MSGQAVREVLGTYLPGATVLFVTKDGRRFPLTVPGHVDQIITELERRGYSVEGRPELRKAS